MQTEVKKWLKEKEYGFLDNGSGPDIMIRKADLVRCQYLKAGTTVEFACHSVKEGLIAKNVRLMRQTTKRQEPNGRRNKSDGSKFIGVMS